LVEICDAHHILNQDNPTAFNRVLRQTLDVLETGEAGHEDPR